MNHSLLQLEQPPFPLHKIIMKNLLFPKRSWTDQEDQLLMRVVEKHGPHKWSYIARFLPNRMGKQCRQRWFNHLDSSISKENWNQQEEWKLYLGHQLLGSKWSQLSKILIGRTDNGIKNHWNSIMRKKLDGFQKRLEIEIQKEPVIKMERNQAINWLLNELVKTEEQIVSDDISDQTGREGVEMTEPQMSMQKSTESDSVSFDHILKRIDQNDKLKMKRIESYKYENTNEGIFRSNKNNCDKGAKEEKICTLKTVAEKENRVDKLQDLDFLQEIDRLPLPPFLNRQSSLDCRIKLLSSPFKQQ